MHHNSLFSSQLTESYQQQQQPTQQDLTPFQTKSNNNRTRSNYNSSNFIMNSFKAFMDNGDASLDEPQTFEQQFNDYCALSRTQRLLGFSVCFALGWLVSLISLIAIPQIAVRPEKFALTYTLGNMISLCSTAFLYGPCAQIRDMCKPIRAGATIIYLTSLGVTLFCAFYLKLVLPTLLSIFVQFLAMVWYSASYIPFGRDILRRCLGGCCESVYMT